VLKLLKVIINTYLVPILFAQKQTNTRDKPNFKMKPRIVLQTFSEKCFTDMIYTIIEVVST